ncbi:AsnC family transcriptional regulator [Thiohalobacter sp. IOR34]|uniref:siroheme decarboxylase subunit beta n=1 Tax=Thiohalobacter sp. IOR34 TaxID=3057176 RepID=UPI0025AFC9E2|nr:AsnC family transcriptional regulator [Thiohalobacter sp. IOR34]WJW75435.1 AsnC family transcriptional regulator [Thiohalobacter sp. IOR34]
MSRPGRTPLAADDRRLIEAIQRGLPLVARPYAAVGERLGMSEGEVLARLARLLEDGVIKRLGVVVRHRELGYRANAMVVWDVPDATVDRLGQCLGQFEFVTLCYRRPRRLPDWPYNLFCMIHGKDRAAVLDKVDFLVERCGLQGIAREVLFSGRRFKQRGAIYRAPQQRTLSGNASGPDTPAPQLLPAW